MPTIYIRLIRNFFSPLISGINLRNLIAKHETQCNRSGTFDVKLTMCSLSKVVDLEDLIDRLVPVVNSGLCHLVDGILR